MFDHTTSVSVIIPCFNEEGGIKKSVADIKRNLPAAEIIIVNDGSTDQSKEIISQLNGVKCIHHPFNKGYGAALKTGMASAKGQYIAWFDADNEHKGSDLAEIYKKISTGRHACIIGKRDRSTSGLRAAGKFAIRSLAKIMGTDLGKDINCGLRIFERSIILPHLNILPDGFSASLTSTMLILYKKYPFSFHNISTNIRVGTSKVRVIHGFQSLLFVIQLALLFSPIKTLFLPGVLFGLISATYGSYIAIAKGLGFPTFSIALLMFSIYLITMGLIGDQLSQIRLNGHDPSSRHRD